MVHVEMGLMAYSHCTGPGLGEGLGNDGLLHYAMYCIHYTGTGTGTGESLFSIVPIPFPVPVLVPVLCSVSEP